MLQLGKSTNMLHRRSCIRCKAQQATPVRPHQVPLRRNVRASFRISEPPGTQDSADVEASCAGQRLPPPNYLPATPEQHVSQPHPSNPCPLKNAQLGHSRFSRGAPHICYGQIGAYGVFYIKPEVDDLVDDWQQWFAGQQQQWVARPQQQWRQQRRHVEAWMNAQHDRFSGLHCPPGLPPTSHLEILPDAGNNVCTTGDVAQSSSSSGATDGNEAGTSDAAQDRQSLLSTMWGQSGASGSLGIAVALAAAVVAALKHGCLHRQGSGQRLLLGAVVGVGAVLLVMQCSKWLVAALLLCYAGISVL